MENIRDILDKLDTAKNIKRPGKILPSSSNLDNDIPKCSICDGKGWVTPDVSIEHPDFGSHYPCICRESTKKITTLKRLMEYSNLTNLSHYTFETLDPKGKNSKNNSNVFQTAFQESFEFALNPSSWLLINGPHGTGKTHLAAAIANQCIISGTPVFFIHNTDLLERLRQPTFSDTDSYVRLNIIDHVKAAPVLILDGFSSSLSSNWVTDKLLLILNYRANLKMPTVITTTDSREKLHPFIKSRVANDNLGKIIYTDSISSKDSPANMGVLPPDIKRMTFKTFDKRGLPNSTKSNKNDLEHALKTAQIYSEHPEGWLTFYSPNTGSGKTHLAAAIANHIISAGKEVFFAVVPELMSYLSSSISPNSSLDTESIFLQLKQTPFMILDELGEERQTAWSQDKLAQLIVYRQNHHLPTVITTRMEIVSMAKQGSSIASRLLDPNMGQIITINSPDYRSGR